MIDIGWEEKVEGLPSGENRRGGGRPCGGGRLGRHRAARNLDGPGPAAIANDARRWFNPRELATISLEKIEDAPIPRLDSSAIDLTGFAFPNQYQLDLSAN